MKTTPINFSGLLEPELIQFWEEKPEAKDASIQIRRSHNFRLKHTELTCILVDKEEKTTVLAQLLLIEIPQQEHHTSLNCMIHLPQVQTPTQMLMVFKKEEDSAMWVRKIIGKIRDLLELQARRDIRKQAAEAALEDEEETPEEETVVETEETPPESEEA